jgi:CheY-like chemotaxis protein/CHASE3 domain sensor protein
MSETTAPFNPRRANRFGPALPPRTFAGFAAAIVTVVLIAFFGYRSLDNEADSAALTTHTLQVMQRVDGLLSSLKDAETGQRGYLLTNSESYLEPYDTARADIPGEIQELRRLTANNPKQQELLSQIQRFGEQKLSEMQETIVLKRAGNQEGALTVVRTDRGKLLMDSIREVIGQFLEQDRVTLAAHTEASRQASELTLVITAGGAAILFVLIIAAGFLTSRDFLTQQTEAWLQSGLAGLSERMQGEQRLETLGANVLGFLARYLDAQVGAMYIVEDGQFRRFAGYALPPGYDAKADSLRPGDGLAGQALKENRVLTVHDVPANYLPVASSLGHANPTQLLIAPANDSGVVHAVIELGFFRTLQASDLELLRRGRAAIGIAVRSSKDRTRLEELLEETQRQSEELQTQQEELRVANEELAEQSQVLKESQVRLESQQAELEQTNSQLEEQASILESQRDELQRAQLALTERAAELARSNQYKSEFLANMSHELRTPLNSSLILAKLLADNKPGTLNEEQVKFAQTIFGAGNDLLALINDILDLSKIEAGKVEVQPESLIVASVVETLSRGFEPLARERRLSFTYTLEPGAPERLETDPQRLGQILKNLLSNAFKFTQEGAISLRVAAAPGGQVTFAVQDSGIGIPSEQQEIIFEAFRQADGSTHRKYGGTGLGLSISRDLARLLGGDVTVKSEAGQGSLFTLRLPVQYPGPVTVDPSSQTGATAAQSRLLQPEPPPGRAPALLPAFNFPATVAPAELRPPLMEDDRARLAGDSRIILIVEDDLRFAAILRDLARELGFVCIATHAGGDALAAAQRFKVHAIILDMNLPDRTGLEVLNELKRNPGTRHIPVHVVSVADFSQEALSLGAVGYALKPVKREQLMTAFERLEAKLQQGVRRVLVVEDDLRQRDSIRQLLSSEGVEISDVATATEALERLKQTTFDCLVLDLSLPDLSGYEMLKRMAETDEVSFPPVIVYTGRSLTRDEEQRLRRFSRSIIIKDVRSPERLLDEVTLFLHQVESKLPVERQRMLREARDRESAFEGRRILIVEDDVRNIFALSKVLEPRGAKVEIARNGREALEVLGRSSAAAGTNVDLVLMDIMMPEMDGLTAMREIRKRPEWQKLPIIALTAKAMKDDQEKCLQAGANDYIAKPLDVDKLLSLVRVWMAQ